MLQKLAAIVLLIGIVAAAVAWSLRPTPPERELALFVNALRDGNDENAYMRMSERYRTLYPQRDFERAIARMTELRSTSGVSLRGDWLLIDRRDDLVVCSVLQGMRARIRVEFVREGAWRIDALRVGEEELDPTRAFSGRCRATD